MICKQAKYKGFRNIDEQTLIFSDGMNIICGDNAQGKTNAIEGIYLCANGRSHRTSHEKEYINFEKDTASIEITYTDFRRTNEMKICWSKNGKRYCEKNLVPIKRLSELIGGFRVVLFTPEHLSIIKDGPGKRRYFLDSAISQLDSEYLSSLQKYSKILAQRNKLIQDAKLDGKISDTILAWSEQLASEGEIISFKRDEYTKKLDGLVKIIFKDMTHGNELPMLVYKSRKSKEEYKKLLSENIDREIKMGTSLFGIHKDDIDITLNDCDTRSFSSQGQQRSMALAMKLAEGEISKELTKEYPVFLFDDVLSELDENRKKYLIGDMKNKQVIITTCDKLNNIENANIIYAKNGTYTQI